MAKPESANSETGEAPSSPRDWRTSEREDWGPPLRASSLSLALQNSAVPPLSTCISQFRQLHLTKPYNPKISQNGQSRYASPRPRFPPDLSRARRLLYTPMAHAARAREEGVRAGLSGFLLVQRDGRTASRQTLMASALRLRRPWHLGTSPLMAVT